jgi:hypothetical protein
MDLQRGKVPLISSHHGDYRRENNLVAAVRVAEIFEEIDIYEIDFVSVGKRVISSHDYEEEAIANGSPVEEWIREFVVKRGKILWLDVKENLTLLMNCGYGKFGVRALFHRLETEWKEAANRPQNPVDIRTRIWIGCQDVSLRERLFEYNQRRCGGRWHQILDMPTTTAYILQRITPPCFTSLLCEYVCRESRESDYRDFDLLSVDRSFFPGRKAMKAFILSLELRPDVLVVLNSFGRNQKPIILPNHRIAMQYDYTVQG